MADRVREDPPGGGDGGRGRGRGLAIRKPRGSVSPQGQGLGRGGGDGGRGRGRVAEQGRGQGVTIRKPRGPASTQGTVQGQPERTPGPDAQAQAATPGAPPAAPSAAARANFEGLSPEAIRKRFSRKEIRQRSVWGKPADKPAYSPGEQADMKKISEGLPTVKSMQQASLRSRKVEEYKAMITRVVKGTSTKDDRENYEQVSEADKSAFLDALRAVTKRYQKVLHNPATSETEEASTKALLEKLEVKAKFVSQDKISKDAKAGTSKKVEEYKAMITRVAKGTSTKDDRKNYGQVSKADINAFLDALEAVTKQYQKVLDNPASSETEKDSAGAAIEKLGDKAEGIFEAMQREEDRHFQHCTGPYHPSADV